MSTDVEVERLRELFRGFQCHGVVALIDYLVSPEAEGCTCLGSSTIGLGEIMNEIWLSKEAQLASAWFRTRSLHIGSSDGSVTPLQWLQKLSEVFGEVSIAARKRFDGLCGEFSRISRLKPAGDVEIFTRRGIFRVPPSAYKKHMTDKELEPYRVERSRIFSDDTSQTRHTALEASTKH